MNKAKEQTQIECDSIMDSRLGTDDNVWGVLVESVLELSEGGKAGVALDLRLRG